MNDITMTLSSPEVPLVEGKGSLSVSVTNAAAVSQRIVLGAFPGTNGAAVAPAADGAASAASTTAPAIATVDRPLRTVAAGATEQYVVAFDVSTSAPGQHVVRLIGYSADRAPEEYADQAQTVTLTVEEKAAPVKKFPWWIVIVAAVVVVAGAVAGVVYAITRPAPEQTLSWVPSGPASASDPAPDAWYALLEGRDCAGLSAAGVEADPLWSAVASMCTAVIVDDAEATATAIDDFGAIPEPDEADCLNHAAWTMLDSFVRIRDEHPDATIIPADTPGFACPLGLVGLSVNGSASVLESATGPLAGGTTIRVIGRFDAPVVVRFGDDKIEATQLDENHFEITTPPVTAEDSRIVQVESAGTLIPGAAQFSYVMPTTPPGTICERFPSVCELRDDLEIDPFPFGFEIITPGF